MIKRSIKTISYGISGWVAVLLPAVAYSQTPERIENNPVTEPAQAAKPAVPNAAAPAALLLEIKRFVVEGENPLSEAQTNALLASHLGQHSSIVSIEAAAMALERAIRATGQSFHRVIVPAQRPVAGELKVQVLKFRLNATTVVGNQHFTRENILRSLPALVPGESPDIRDLGRQVTLANEHPAKRMTVSIKESPRVDHLDVELKVRDVPTAQTFVGLTGHGREFDNTINKNTGYTRLTIGHQQSNLFDRDHAATIAYTTSPDHTNKVSQWGLFYWLPLYGYHTSISAHYTKSNVDTGVVGVGGQDFAVSGSGEFRGVRVTYALPKSGEVTHNLALAYDQKYFENKVAFAGTPLPTTSVGSQPLALRYTARSEQPWGSIGGHLEYARNLSGGRANDANSYATARTNARERWETWRWGIDVNRSLSAGWSLTGKLRGQHTSDALIPGEQFGLGGIGSVRGLRDREGTGDRGFTVNVEATAPPVAPGLIPFAFYDIGQRKHVTPVAATANKENASSVGAGVRWNWKGMDVNLTYAHVLNGVAGGTPRGYDKLDFSVFYRF